MLRKLSVFGLLVVLAVISLAGCKMNTEFTPPAGDAADYTKIDSSKSVYDLTPGSGYYYKKLLPTTANAVSKSTSFTFNVTKTGKVYYKEALHSGTPFY